jgi:hypothetical protein
MNQLVSNKTTFIPMQDTLASQACAWVTWKYMKSLIHTHLSPVRALRVAALLAALGGAASLLTGCYVVPVHPAQHPAAVVYTQAAPSVAPAPLNFTARLYPANDQACAYGMVTAVVTNDLNGRGTFSTTINGESFSGEATRAPGSGRGGTANGAGNRGSFISCSYQMNSATLGSGQCKHSSGALFSMHVGG